MSNQNIKFFMVRYLTIVFFCLMSLQVSAQQTSARSESSDMAPDFTLNDIDGNPLSLSSLRGKYVVLDFWGSWCVWCIKGMPEMKKYYAKYKDKLQILGIDCGDTEEKWKASVSKLELPWLHVYCPKGNDLLKMYGIRGFPTKFVVDPQGCLVKAVVGEDPAFYTYLDELLKE